MAYNQQNAFWDWARSFDRENNHGEGVDRVAEEAGPNPFGGLFGYGTWQPHHPAPPPPPPPPHGPGHHDHHAPPPPPPPHFPSGFPFGGGSPFGPGHRGGFPHRGGPHGRGFGRHGRGGRRCGRPERGGPEHERQGPWGAFDLSGFLSALASHPAAQPYRHLFEQAMGGQTQQSGEVAREAENEEEATFTPPIDIFSTETHYVLHVALPGAKKEDVGINWDTEQGVLNVAGVIYRQGDEEFLKTLTQSERSVGVFERAVKLPPAESGEGDEIDGDAITAKLEDGVLIVRVPKVEKEWTDVKKVDIE